MDQVESKYSFENDLANKILGEKDAVRMNKYLRWLKYESIGEFIHFEIIDWRKTLGKFSHFQKHELSIRLNQFRLPTIPRPLRWTRVLQFENNFHSILFDLRKGLIEELFQNEESFEILVNYVNDARSLISHLSTKGHYYVDFLFIAEAQLERKRPSDEILIPTVQNRPALSESPLIPFPLVNNSDMSLLTNFFKKLGEKGLISDAKDFINPFISPGNRAFSKVMWNGESISLLFVIEYCIMKGLILKQGERSIKISTYFRTAKDEQLNTNTINNYASKMGFTLKDDNLKSLKVKNYIDNCEHSEILSIVSAFKEEVKMSK